MPADHLSDRVASMVGAVGQELIAGAFCADVGPMIDRMGEISLRLVTLAGMTDPIAQDAGLRDVLADLERMREQIRYATDTTAGPNGPVH